MDLDSGFLWLDSVLIPFFFLFFLNNELWLILTFLGERICGNGWSLLSKYEFFAVGASGFCLFVFISWEM